MCMSEHCIVWSQLFSKFMQSVACCMCHLPINYLPSFLSQPSHSWLWGAHSRAHHVVCSLKTILVNGSGISSLQLQAEAVANGHRSPAFQAVPTSGHGCPPHPQWVGAGCENWDPWDSWSGWRGSCLSRKQAWVGVFVFPGVRQVGWPDTGDGPWLGYFLGLWLAICEMMWLDCDAQQPLPALPSSDQESMQQVKETSWCIVFRSPKSFWSSRNYITNW